MIMLSPTLVIFLSLKYGFSNGESNVHESEIYMPEMMQYRDNNDAASNELPLDDVNPALDNNLERFSEVLLGVLKQPWSPNGIPLLYIEDNNLPNSLNGQENMENAGGAFADARMEDLTERAGLTAPTWKRSRYYRRYPWKRQNSRSRTRYEVDNRYMCQPSREDVFKLLVALHETRAGNGGKSINFCNRRRSASAIFTNIRFLGKK